MRRVAKAVGLPDSAEEKRETRIKAVHEALRKALRNHDHAIALICHHSGVDAMSLERLSRGEIIDIAILAKASPYLLRSGLRLDPETLEFVSDRTSNLNAPTPEAARKAPAPVQTQTETWPTRDALPPLASPIPDKVEARALSDVLGGLTEPVKIDSVRKNLRASINWAAADPMFVTERTTALIEMLFTNRVAFRRQNPLRPQEHMLEVNPEGLNWIRGFM